MSRHELHNMFFQVGILFGKRVFIVSPFLREPKEKKKKKKKKERDSNSINGASNKQWSTKRE